LSRHPKKRASKRKNREKKKQKEPRTNAREQSLQNTVMNTKTKHPFHFIAETGARAEKDSIFVETN